MACPNCGFQGKPAHRDGCLLGTLLHVLQDRGHDLSEVDISEVDDDLLWQSYGGPATDWVAEQLGLPAYPDEDEDPDPTPHPRSERLSG